MGEKAGKIASIERNAAGQLVVRMTGRDEPFVDARIARCLPWSQPEEYVSVLDADGKELQLLRSLDELDRDSRQVADEELRIKVFSPKIQRIESFRTEFGVTSITAMTDRGKVTFQIRTREDVRVLSAGRALLRDVDGNTYELPDATKLSGPGQKFFQQFL